ncbi:MAG: flagellar biosynthesis protein FlhB [Hyphomicrobiaceae bacterium]|nr:flagellar biosynthesis protein FlhB [Hyphomicrobiaceae bacterium]
MAEEADKDTKTEEATPRRIEEALRKGNTPSSRETISFASIVGIVAALKLGSETITGAPIATLATFIDRPNEFSLATAEDATRVMLDAGLVVGAGILPPLLVLMAAGFAGSALQNTPRIALDRIKPDKSRLSILKGLQRIFGAHARIEVTKAILKLVLLGTIVSIYFHNFRYGILNSILIGPGDIPAFLVGKTSELFLTVAVFLSVLVGADLLWSRFKWHRDLRMSKQEVKDEHKQAEGDPLVKARQRSLARDRARRRMLAAVPKATVVIANPTHYAVALRYVKGEQIAPVVVAKGLDHIALKIREIAELHGIPVVADRALARSLYDVVAPDRPIPTEFYKAVAEIILHLMSRAPAVAAGETRIS